MPFDPAAGEATGRPIVVLTNVHRGIDSVGSFDVSPVWLTSAAFGPAEWLWRMFACLRRVPPWR